MFVIFCLFIYFFTVFVETRAKHVYIYTYIKCAVINVIFLHGEVSRNVATFGRIVKVRFAVSLNKYGDTRCGKRRICIIIHVKGPPNTLNYTHIYMLDPRTILQKQLPVALVSLIPLVYLFA